MLGGMVEDKIVKDIGNMGYRVNVTVLNSADYYVPQKRERVIFIANRINKTNYHPGPLIKPDSYITTKQAIEDLIMVDDDKDFNHLRTKHSDDMKQRLSSVLEGD
jgi:DNA (cytosine-5)-methyltransferase 1